MLRKKTSVLQVLVGKIFRSKMSSAVTIEGQKNQKISKGYLTGKRDLIPVLHRLCRVHIQKEFITV
jgi:hypothetical protein